jgi:drug/metabolite transporter superfamily protein YnfA
VLPYHVLLPWLAVEDPVVEPVIPAKGVDSKRRATSSGSSYAAYGGIFIALSLMWGIILDGFRPDRYDLLGALMCVAGVVVMVAPPRG